MGQKVHPIGFRLGITRDWEAAWFATKEYAENLSKDILIRSRIKEALKKAGVSKIKILRKAAAIDIEVWAARPGAVIGKDGSDIAYLRGELSKEFGKNINININEEKNSEISASLLGEMVAQQLEKRFQFRRAIKNAVQRALKGGAKGIKIECSGRLGGAEIARREWHREGRVPLHTLRADIDYAFSEALTTYGKIGVKVWVYRGEVFNYDPAKKSREKSIGRV